MNNALSAAATGATESRSTSEAASKRSNSDVTRGKVDIEQIILKIKKNNSKEVMSSSQESASSWKVSESCDAPRRKDSKAEQAAHEKSAPAVVVVF